MGRLFTFLPLLLLGCATEPDHRARPTSAIPIAPTVGDAFGIPPVEYHNECNPDLRPAFAAANQAAVLVDAHAEIFGDRQPEPFHVHLGWPSSDPSTSISMLWRTDVETLASAVELTEAGGEPVLFEGGSFLFGDQRMHEVRLCDGLAPSTAYSYRVGGPGHWSEPYSFTTPGPPNSFDTFRVAVLGDSRGSYEEFGELMQMAESYDPDFYVFNGDMVESGSYQAQWDQWFDATGDILARKVLVPAHGNHEYLSANYFAQFAMPNNEEWFSIRYGDLHLVSLNDTVRHGLDDLEAEADYLEKVFSTTESGWRVVAHHQPPWTACTAHPSNQTLRELWGPVYDTWGVDLALSGHNHIYERSVPIRDGFQMPDGKGTVYMVTGGAGAPLYQGFTDQWYSAVVEPSKHFVIVDFGPDRISGQTISPAGNLLDRWAVPRTTP